MKHLLTILIMACLFGSLVFISALKGPKQDSPCKIVQRFYLNGKLVEEKAYETIAKDYGCVNSYLINGRNIRADSVVTTLK